MHHKSGFIFCFC